MSFISTYRNQVFHHIPLMVTRFSHGIKIKTDISLEQHEFNGELVKEIMKIVNEVRKHNMSRRNGLKKLYSLDTAATEYETKIIFSIGNMLMKLPDDVLMDDVEEMELITRYLDPALHPLFDDLDNDVLFRWSNTINLEAKTPTNIYISKRRPDATIDCAEGNYLQQTFGFGEVKCQGEAKNYHALSMDLIRLGVFSKNATDLGNLKGVLSFQAIGHQVAFYITKLLSDGLYVMLEIGRIDVPRSLRELVSHLVHLDDVLNLVHAFHDECGAATTITEESIIKARKRPTVTTPEMIRVVDPTRSRKRRCITAYYS